MHMHGITSLLTNNNAANPMMDPLLCDGRNLLLQIEHKSLHLFNKQINVLMHW